MSQELITTSNADRNLAAGATVLSATPDASNPRLCQVLVYLGDGTKNLTGAGGAFTVTITIGGRTWNGGARSYVIGTAVQSCLVTDLFPVPANAAVTVAITSPNAGDTDVDCTAYLVSESSASASAAASILEDTGTTVPAQIAALNNITAASVLAAGDVDGYTLEQSLKLMLAALAGKVSGGSTTSVVIRAADDSRARITATVDGSGNRTALTLDATN